MSIIEIVYKATYNYFAKSQGDKSLPYLSASSITLLFNISVVINCEMAFNLAINNKISLFSMTKTSGIIFSGLLIIVNYFILFKILKFGKYGDDANNRFNISNQTYLFRWRLVIISFLIMIIVPIVWSYFNR